MAELSAAHRAELETGSVIAPELIEMRGYRTVSAERADELRALGIARTAWAEARLFPGLLIPQYRVTGELIACQWKPAVPAPGRKGKPMKYVSPAGVGNVLDVHPVNRAKLADPAVPLFITEGVKKADALASRGLCVIALTGVWNWRRKLGTLGDWEDVPLKGRRVVVVYDADAVDNPQVRSAMTRLGAWLASKGAAAVSYVVVPAEVNGTAVKGADDFLAAGGTVEALAAVATDKPPGAEVGDTFTDARMAETLAAEVLEGRYVWCRALGWLAWDGRRWAGVTEETVTEQARQWALDRYVAAVKAGHTSDAVHKGWHGMLSRARQVTAVAGARGIVQVYADELDAHPDLLNVANGVVDLSTGNLREHDPELMLTKLAPVEHHPDATHPDWDAALEALPEQVRSWYQLRCGQAATGHMTPDDVMVVAQGGGDNGKTTLTTGIARVLGDYFTLVSHRALLASPDAHPTELMDFRGARFALLEETPEERRLSVVRLKTLLGTPQVTARLIRRDTVTFDASHSLFLSTNYRPVVEETDHGTWRRLVLLRFPYTFRKPGEVLTGPDDRAGDPTLRERVKGGEDGQHEAVLAWLVAGAVAWHKAGRVFPAPPERVIEDTRAWRVESDLILAYLDERLVFDPAAHVMSADLLTDFNGWLATKGARPWGDRAFASRFGGHAEVTAHRVEQGRTRPDTMLSRPAYPGVDRQPQTPPARYRAWLGLRFRTTADDASSTTDDHSRDQGKHDPGTAGTATPVNPRDAFSIGVNRSSCPSRPSDDPGYDVPRCPKCHEPYSGAPPPYGHCRRCGPH